jgi:hypothetical protein
MYLGKAKTVPSPPLFQPSPLTFGSQKTAINTPLKPIPGYSSVHVAPAQAKSFVYSSYYPKPKSSNIFYYLPNMVGLHGIGRNEGLHASAMPGVASGASAGAAVGGPWGAAVGAVVGLTAGLVSGKAHYSPWNFLYDDYPQHIYENEITINGLRNAVARYTGAPQTPDPPMYSKKGGAQYQASMQAIVPKYVPGSESQIAAYDRKLNEAGGAYETTVKQQISLAPQLQAQLQNLQATSQMLPTQPASGSATAPLPYGPPGAQPLTAPQTPYQGPYSPPPLLPQYQSGPTMTPGNYPGGAPQLADMFGGSMSGYMPYILGAIGLAAILLSQKSGGTVRTVYRTAPSHRR